MKHFVKYTYWVTYHIHRDSVHLSSILIAVIQPSTSDDGAESGCAVEPLLLQEKVNNIDVEDTVDVFANH